MVKFNESPLRIICNTLLVSLKFVLLSAAVGQNTVEQARRGCYPGWVRKES